MYVTTKKDKVTKISVNRYIDSSMRNRKFARTYFAHFSQNLDTARKINPVTINWDNSDINSQKQKLIHLLRYV